MRTLTPQWRHVITGQWILIAVLSVSMMIMYTAFYRLSDCQNDYMAKQYEAQQARISVADTERDSLARVFVTITGTNREAAKKAILDHTALLAHNNEVRAKTPYPELPKTC